MTLIQVVNAVFNGLSILLIAYLAHRRSFADLERHKFERQMRKKLNINRESGEAIKKA